MSRSRLAVWGVVTLAAMAACGIPSLAEAEKRPEAVKARALIEAVARGSIDAIEPDLSAELKTSQSSEQLQRVATFFPKEAATRSRLVGFNVSTMAPLGGEKTSTTAVSYELNYPGTNLVATVTLRQIGGGPLSAVGFNLTPLAAPLDVLNAVTFAGKGPLHYLFLMLMVAAVTVTVVALVVWGRRRKTLYRRWWWLLGILLGAFKITLNWNTGEVYIQALTVQVFSVAFQQEGPLILALSLPVGAVAFLILQRRAARAAAAPLPPAAA